MHQQPTSATSAMCNYLTARLEYNFANEPKLWLCAAVGALVGAAGVQTAHVISDRNSRELFGQRLRCKALADKYVRGRSHTIALSRVEFSRTRGSCIASTFEQVGL